MGQLFSACAYDIKTKEACVLCVDKFHANCYSYCGEILSIHYLLRQKPWRIMWGGRYVVLNDKVRNVAREEDLYGLSTYLDYQDFEMNTDNLEEKDYYHKVKLICDYQKMWTEVHVMNKAYKFFDWDNTKSVKYEGYLVNHDKKTAVNLADYYRQSKSMSNSDFVFVIDLLPVLTETGEGTPMALYEGITTDVTEELAGIWCGDELQIVDELPKDYKVINCCFAEVWNRANYCYSTFGVNADGYLLKDENQNLCEVTKLSIAGIRGKVYNLLVEKTEKGIKYIPKPLEGSEEPERKNTVVSATAGVLLKMGASVEEVMSMTGLTEEEIQKIKEDLENE